MIKRALLLTAATVALLSGPAYAATCTGSSSTLCDITTVITTPIATSTVQASPSDIKIETTGAINVTTSTAPALKLDSDNNIIIDGTISNKNTSNAVGAEIVAGHGSATTTVGTFDDSLGALSLTNVVSIDLTGSGTGKIGVLIDTPTVGGTGTIDATATTPADVTAGIIPGINIGSMKVTGDNSYGVHMLSGVTLDGPLSIDGAVSVTSSTTTAGTATGVTGVEVDGSIVGNLSVATSLLGGAITTTGAGGRALVVFGPITGSIINNGTIATIGAAASSSSTPSTTGNPQGGTAFTLGNSVSAGIYNGGPSSSGDSTGAATITTQGGGPAILISSTISGSLSPGPLNVGLYAPDVIDPGFDFYNRGQISAQPPNVDVGALAMHIVGANSAPVTFQGGTIGANTYLGGILNSGLIGASASSDGGATNGIASTALWIDDYATVPQLVNTNEVGPGHGNISASVSGASPGQAIAILIAGDGLSGNGTLNSIVNSGTISASAVTTDPTSAFLTAIAISDKSGTLSSITNTGTISATTCVTSTSACGLLDNKNQETHTAVNAQVNTSGINFQNAGTVVGDVFFGTGQDTLHVFGTINAHASVLGNINFNGSNGSGHDTLTLDNYATVNGAVLENGGGFVNITVGAGGSGTSLFINNTDFASTTQTNDGGKLEVGTLDVKTGSTFGIALSQGFNQTANAQNPVLITGENAGSSANIHIESGALFDVTFGSFVSTPGGNAAKFVLLDVPSTGSLVIDNQTAIKTSIESSIPFLFSGSVCQYNLVGVLTACSGSGVSDTQLVLNLTPKTVGDAAGQLPLSGYAKTIFPYVNAALADDNDLGAAVIAAGSGLSNSVPTDVTTGNKLYQDIYAQFAPDVTGGSRAIVVSLTDQATSVLGAHQRALRMYAGQGAAATLWGQEFVQRLDTGTNKPNGYRDSGFGFALGADGGSPSSGRYGAALTFFSGDILEKTPAQVKTSSDWYLFSGYTDWRGKGLFFDSQVSVGYGSLTGRRSLFIDNASNVLLLSRTATDKRSALLAAGGFSTGAVMNMGSLVFMPQLSMDALSMRENGYVETGGGNGFDLRVDPYYAKSLRTYLGGTLREDLKLGSFYLQPEARLGYRYDLLADPVKMKAIFAADPTATAFTLTGPDPAKGNVVLGAGIAATTGSWSIGIDYDLLSGSGSTQHTGTFTLIGRI